MSGGSGRRLGLARLLGSAVGSQALLSAASFGIGLVLIRGTNDLQYGSYILASSAVLLLVSLQNAFVNPALATRMARLDLAGRADLVGGLYRDQRRILPAVAALAVAIVLGLWALRQLDAHSAPMLLATLVAALAFLHREYLRMALFCDRRPYEVMRIDVLYVVLAVGGALLATRSDMPAVVAMLTLTLAAVVSGLLLVRTLRVQGLWNGQGTRGILHEIAPLAAWSTAGAAIHWTFSQGYIYMVGGRLGVAAVAAIAATRLLMMPVNLLSTGIGSLMLPLTSGWLHQHGSAIVLRRLCLFALGLVLVTVGYFSLLWWSRDWIFAAVLKKQFAQRDALLLLWGALFLVMVVRDQIVCLLAAQGRFRALTLLTLASAVVSLCISYVGTLEFGVVGALVGLLAGELMNVIGIVTLSFRQPPTPQEQASAA